MTVRKFETTSEIPSATTLVEKRLHSAADIEAWLVSYLAELLEMEPSQFDISADFTTYGLDSLAMAGMASDLAQALGTEISPDSAYSFSTIQDLSRHLAEVTL